LSRHFPVNFHRISGTVDHDRSVSIDGLEVGAVLTTIEDYPSRAQMTKDGICELDRGQKAVKSFGTERIFEDITSQKIASGQHFVARAGLEPATPRL
jgi:hypothetical protein